MKRPGTGHESANRYHVGRRRLFLSAAIGGAVLVAGCLADDPASANGDGTNEDGANGDETNASTPVEAVDSYFVALEEGDRERANRYAHEDGDYGIDDDALGILEDALESDSIDRAELETVSLETAVETMHADAGEEPEVVDDVVEREREAIDHLETEYGFTDYAYVRHEAAVEGGPAFNPTFLLFEREGEWLIWSLPTAPAREHHPEAAD